MLNEGLKKKSQTEINRRLKMTSEEKEDRLQKTCFLEQ